MCVPCRRVDEPRAVIRFRRSDRERLFDQRAVPALRGTQKSFTRPLGRTRRGSPALASVVLCGSHATADLVFPRVVRAGRLLVHTSRRWRRRNRHAAHGPGNRQNVPSSCACLRGSESNVQPSGRSRRLCGVGLLVRDSPRLRLAHRRSPEHQGWAKVQAEVLGSGKLVWVLQLLPGPSNSRVARANDARRDCQGIRLRPVSACRPSVCAHISSRGLSMSIFADRGSSGAWSDERGRQSGCSWQARQCEGGS
jgi:hypothetical protein